MNVTAYEQGGVWHVHSGNQFATRTGALAAGALGVDPKHVVLRQYFMGGGFGRRFDGDMVIPAVLAAKAVGKQGPGRLPARHARRRGRQQGGRQEARQCAAHRGRPCRLGLRPTAEDTGLGIACVSSQERATATWTACAAVVELNPTNGAF